MRLIDEIAVREKFRNCLAYMGTDVKRILAGQPTVDAVVFPCKVGDWVYALWSVPTNYKYVIYCAEVKEIRIAKRNCRLTTTYFLEPIEYRGRRKEYKDDDFGNLVFLTREEAEQALKERLMEATS